MKPEEFILNSDFATLKNDSVNNSASITVPSLITLLGLGVAESHVDLSAGLIGAGIRSRIRSSKFSNRWLAVPQLVFTRIGTSGGNPSFYQIIAYVYPINAGTIRCSVMVVNPVNAPLTGATGAETFDFNVATFLPPFS